MKDVIIYARYDGLDNEKASSSMVKLHVFYNSNKSLFRTDIYNDVVVCAENLTWHKKYDYVKLKFRCEKNSYCYEFAEELPLVYRKEDNIDNEELLMWTIEAAMRGSGAELVSAIRALKKLSEKYDYNVYEFAEEADAEQRLLDKIPKKIKDREEKAKKIIEAIRFNKKLYEKGKVFGRYFPANVVRNLIAKDAVLEGAEAYKILMLDGKADIQVTDYYCREVLKTDPFCPERVWAVAFWSLKEIETNGSTCMELNEWQTLLKDIMGKYCSDPCIYIPNYLAAVVLIENFADFKRCEDEHWYIYRRSTFNLEKNVLYNLHRLNKTGKNWYEQIKGTEIDDIQEQNSMIYNEEQRGAFNLLCRGGVKALTGLAGTGKTAVIRGLVTYWGRYRQEKYGSVTLLASTGMAAKVMTQKVGREASTIHKELKIIPNEDENLDEISMFGAAIDAGLIIIDESSMIDLRVFSILLSRIKNETAVIFVGDDGQLPPVGIGQPFSDIMKISDVQHVHLQKIMRNSGAICTNAEVIRSGKGHLQKEDDFVVKLYSDDLTMLRNVAEEATADQGQCICPVKSENNGCEKLNNLMQPKTNNFLIKSGKRSFFRGDKIVCLRNDYELELYNGDIGIVTGRIGDNPFDCDMTANIAGKDVFIPRSYFQDVDLAYCITVHKSQGSEFSVTHVVLPMGPEIIMTSRLLYTAVTRAKTQVIIHAVQNQKIKFNGKLVWNTANVCFLNRPENVRCTQLSALY